MHKPLSPEEKAKRKKINKILFPIILVLIIALMIANCSDENETTSTSQAFQSLESKKVTACIMSREFIKERLKSPATADFPTCHDGKTLLNESDSTFSIDSYVDSQNSFGALIRTKYKCIIKYIGGDNWKLVDIQLYE